MELEFLLLKRNLKQLSANLKNNKGVLFDGKIQKNF